MSKRHSHHANQSSFYSALSHEEEYRVVQQDLVRVIILNSIYLAGILALFYFNKNEHFLEQWFSKLVKF